MKTILTVVFASSMLAAVAAHADDNWAEERYRAKMGRYTPAGEARRANLKAVDAPATGECLGHGCCRRSQGSRQAVSAAPRSEFLRAKLGRGFTTQPALEQHQGLQASVGAESRPEAWRVKWGRTARPNGKLALVASAHNSCQGHPCCG